MLCLVHTIDLVRPMTLIIVYYQNINIQTKNKVQCPSIFYIKCKKCNLPKKKNDFINIIKVFGTLNCTLVM